jgi:hypothetical protein
MAGLGFVLVHSPLVGPSSWRPVADELAARGRPAVVPSLVDAVAAPPHHDAVADAVGAQVAGRSDEAIVLVVHSGAGALVPSLEDASAAPVAAVVFVDATLPHPGQRWLDTVPVEMADGLRALADPDGVLPPWHEWFPADAVGQLVPDPQTRAEFCAEIPRVPLSYFAEVAPARSAWQERPCGYVQLSEAYVDAADEARRRGWPVARHDGHHLSAMTEPVAVTDAIIAVLDGLGFRGS